MCAQRLKKISCVHLVPLKRQNCCEKKLDVNCWRLIVKNRNFTQNGTTHAAVDTSGYMTRRRMKKREEKRRRATEAC